MKYYDKNGIEIVDGCSIKYPDGSIKKVYTTEDGELGTDATKQSWVESGKAAPCEYGIYAFDVGECAEVEVVE